MHSFLVVSKNKKNALEYAIKECKKNQINTFDINTLTFEKAVGIEDIRNFQKQVILKPFKSKTKAVVLEGSNGLTIEAQNALLKILEEPPANTIIYITIPNKDLVLSTILSRCKVVGLKEKETELSKEEITQYLNILISIPSSGAGDRLKLAQDLAKNKDDAIPWLEKVIIVTRKELISHICHSEAKPRNPLVIPKQVRDDNMTAAQYLSILISLQKTYTVLKTTNVNQRLALENLFLNF